MKDRENMNTTVSNTCKQAQHADRRRARSSKKSTMKADLGEWTPQQSSSSTTKGALPVHDGVLRTGINNYYVPYHIALCYRSDDSEEMFYSLALRTCKIACIVADVSRGRPIPPMLAKCLTGTCYVRLQHMWQVLDYHFTYTHNDVLRRTLVSNPALPQLIHSLLTTPNHCESVVHLTVGTEDFWASIVLERRNNEWICTYADIG